MGFFNGRRLLVAGSGYTGTAVALELRDRGANVWATTRSIQKSEILKTHGITPVLFQLNTPLPSLPVDAAVLCPAPDTRTDENYDLIYNRGIRSLVDDLQACGVDRILYTSSVGVYEISDGREVDETTPVAPATGRGRALAAAEKWVLDSESSGLVLRLAGIYGPDRNRIMDIRQEKITAEGLDSFLNLIHLEDVVGSVLHLLEQGNPRNIYLGVDHEPVLKRDLVNWIADRLGIPVAPSFQKSQFNRDFGGKRCQNGKLLEAGYRFRYPTYREGYTDLIHRFLKESPKPHA